jgi:hypothetical protein
VPEQDADVGDGTGTFVGGEPQSIDGDNVGTRLGIAVGAGVGILVGVRVCVTASLR